ncbi:alpha/beta hydrolase [Aestuariicella hydrocarbonica]|uniref:Alpha/beta hydrolase n=1 Tax=Pseudomaricurvus hydrocarbonicus TaxID=1470433 RepID=A0A9E5MN96_9GAMM|nr:alpha/beta hydrolase [Aestuariicella hydrocarbonica]NHO67360.1 alpha/beta hydrolase [Aestuariicella hydrocarbonica]
MKSVFVLLSALLVSGVSWAQSGFELKRIDTPPQTDAIPLYEPGEIPESNIIERWNLLDRNDGNESRRVRNVTWPTITPVLPAEEDATGLAVIVAPGGAYKVLAIDKEGFDIAKRLAEQGVAAFVLKYRINETPDDESEIMRQIAENAANSGNRSDKKSAKEPAKIEEPRAGADALQALRLIRARASEWGVDPERVGFIGFSAGAMTGLQTVITGKADEQADFLGYIYGPMKSVSVPEYSPPMFSAIAMDDALFSGQGFGIINAWRDAGISVELHAYERGGHGFGAGKPGTTTEGIMDQFMLWLKSRNLLSAQ